MKKILIIPSWYPLESDKIPGLFFRDQALLLKDVFEFGVLYGKQKTVNIFCFVFRLILKSKSNLKLVTPPEGKGFIYLNFRIPVIFRMFSPLRNWCEHLNYFVMISQFRKEYEDLNWIPDLIHSHSTVDGGIVAHAIAKQYSIPFIITEHQVFLPGTFSPFKKRLIKKALCASKKVLAVSEHQKRQILLNQIECSPEIIGNLVDEKVFHPMELSVEEEKIFKIMYVSYDSYIKDNETFFKVLTDLIDNKIIDFRVLIIGGSFQHTGLTGTENPFFKFAIKYKVIEFVEILDFINHEEMVQYFNKCDVLVSTSIAETFGVAMVEAMMCGIPVVSTANGGIDDFILEENGIKVPIRDHEALAEALIRIKNHKSVFDKKAIRNSVLSKYGISAFSEKLTKVYNNCIPQ